MRSSIFILASFLLLIASPLAAQSWTLARHAGGPGNDYGDRIALGRDGSTYVFGVYGGTATFDTVTLTGPGHWNLYLVKYDRNGSVVWGKTVAYTTAAASDIFANAIALGRDGQIYIAGRFVSDITIGGAMHTSAGSSDMYLAKLSATGDPIWVRTPGGTGNGSFGQDEIRAIALDSAGNCYVTGTYNTDARFDTISLASTLTFEAFIAKYDSAGRALWARSGGGFGAFHTPLGIAVNAAGDCYVTGSFFNYLVFGADTLDAVDAEQKSFIVKLDRDGDVIWAEKIGTGGYYGAGQDVALDRDGNAYVTGQFRATISFGTKEHSYFNQLKYAVLVVKYDRDGHYVWSTQSDGPDQAAGALRICVDADGNLYTVGSFSADIRFGATQLTGLQGNAFIAKLDPQGNWVQAEQISGPGSVTGSALAITPDGDCEVVGTFSDSIALGAATLRSSGGLDMFLARLGGNPSGVELPSPQPASALVLSPNPVANLLQLRGIGKPDRIEIFSIEGIRVLDAPANDPLDVSGLAPGTYMVKAGKRIAKMVKVNR